MVFLFSLNSTSLSNGCRGDYSMTKDESNPTVEHKRSLRLLRSMAIGLGSSVVLYSVLEALSAMGLRDAVRNWNSESVEALTSWQLLGWWKCINDPLVGRCVHNPVLYILNTNSVVGAVIKLLELAAAIPVFIWLAGTGSFQKGLKTEAVQNIGLFLVLSAIITFVGKIFVLFKLSPHEGVGLVISGLIGLACLFLFPLVFVAGLYGLLLVALATILSVPVLLFAILVSGALENVLPENPSLAVIVSAWLTVIYQCTGETLKVSLHDLMKHAATLTLISFRRR